MCTALSFLTGSHYFGRTLDLEYHYAESVVVTPEHFTLAMRHCPALERHYAIIGIATVADGSPLYYDAANEKGLAIAGLNFPVSARYHSVDESKDNIAPFELIPWVLGQCANVPEAVRLLAGVNLTDTAFSPQYPAAPLHWMISDRQRSIVVEPMESGLVIHENPVCVLTNEPPFDIQRLMLNNYAGLSSLPPENRFSPALDMEAYSRGMGALGLPGDMSSPSRFVRTAFARHNSVCGMGEEESVSQFFHIIDIVSQPRGCVRIGDGYVTTVYASCCNTDRGIYYYTTYENRSISSVDLHRAGKDGSALISYPLLSTPRIFPQN